MKKKIIGIVLLVSIVLILSGCNGEIIKLHNVTVRGHVVDYTDGDPIVNAKIYANSSYKGTTDKNGYFQINYLSGGISTLRIKKANYISQTYTITPNEDGLITIEDDIRLKNDNNTNYSASISGKVDLGNAMPAANKDDPYEGVKVMATVKETIGSTTIYRIYSDVVDVDINGNYYIEHARTGVNLTIIGVEDYNNNYYIEEGEFFDEYTIPFPLDPHEELNYEDLPGLRLQLTI